ncbi:hypothetical protein [Roseiarcus sp.]|uniref:hypothetical protein n=1 Tax=Roseiarcus sp. TaxID=1969460 RepID=UPI003C3781A5
MFANRLLTGAIGLVLGILLVWWVAPDTGSGAVFLVAVAMIACFVIREIAVALLGLYRKSGASGGKGNST